MRTRLAVLSMLEVVTFASALIYALRRIALGLERIGGAGDSYLAKISFGVRAIETETSHLAPEVVKLNASLDELATNLGAVDQALGAVASALSVERTGAP
jgi:hypothetical protein